MKPPNRSENIGCDRSTTSLRLMVSGFVCPESGCALSIAVRRGMTIRSMEGVEVGKVAAVVLNGDRRNATHILLGCLPERRGYWLVPVDLIVEVCDEGIQLSIPTQAIETLARWHSE